MRTYLFPALLIAVLALFGCSDGSSDAPPANAPHPQGWIEQHGAEALKSPDFQQCAGCHGNDLRGQGGVPSCYSASIDGHACHAGGPVIPHPLDGTYLSGNAHGPQAKQDLTVCQSCHGQPGGPGSNPRFNLGISAAGGEGCESCHGERLAHPLAWAGPNNTFHYSAQSIGTSCTLCHGRELDGVDKDGKKINISCIGCHKNVSDFTLDCTFCHGYPPDGSADVATTSGVDHKNVSQIIYHVTCTMCHGMSKSTADGGFEATTKYTLFDKGTDTIGDHWDGNINMNSGQGYNPENFGCNAASCHGNTPGFRLSDSKLPVVLKPYVGGN